LAARFLKHEQIIHREYAEVVNALPAAPLDEVQHKLNTLLAL
jgi:hypothetical protein